MDNGIFYCSWLLYLAPQSQRRRSARHGISLPMPFVLVLPDGCRTIFLSVGKSAVASAA